MNSLKDSQVNHAMNSWILELSSDLGADDLDFFDAVAQFAREECVGECFEAGADLQLVPGADFFLWLLKVAKV